MADIVKENWRELYNLGLRRIENPEATKGKYRSWLHIDTLETGVDVLTVVNP